MSGAALQTLVEEQVLHENIKALIHQEKKIKFELDKIQSSFILGSSFLMKLLT